MPVFSVPVLFSLPVQRPHSENPGVFFSHANNTVINGGVFTNINNPAIRRDGFQILQKHVTPAAFHNSKQRIDPPRCHAKTREAVLEELFDWVTGNAPRKTWIAWLNGAAGAGKSAICQSFAELCIQRGVKVASFFFSRTDATRNTIDPVIATLVYQLIRLIPETKEFITQSVESDPLIFEQSFATQLDVLIVNPIRNLLASMDNLTLLLIIDGIDECTGDNTQMHLIDTFAKLLQNRDLPISILFASRRESHIQMSFNTRDIENILKQVPLDDNYRAERDIQLFLNDRFNDIKHTHLLRRHLGPEWPAPEHVQQIVDKSSGQFVYAAVVVQFVSMPSSNPSTQLEIVRGLRPAGRSTPFAELDVLYRHIFSQVKNIAIALGFLAYHIFVGKYSMRKVFYLFDIAEDDGESILAPLTSVLSHNPEQDRLVLYHASLPDFLQDKERSQDYYISDEVWGTQLSLLWFKNATSGRFKNFLKGEQNTDLADFLYRANLEASPNLRALIADYRPQQTPTAYAWISFQICIISFISKNDFGDNGKLHRSMFNSIVKFIQTEYPDDMTDSIKLYAPNASDFIKTSFNKKGVNLSEVKNVA